MFIFLVFFLMENLEQSFEQSPIFLLDFLNIHVYIFDEKITMVIFTENQFLYIFFLKSALSYPNLICTVVLCKTIQRNVDKIKK